MKKLRDFRLWFEKNKIPFPEPRQEAKLDQFPDLLLNWNRKISLTADDNRNILFSRHLLDSLIPLTAGIQNENYVADIGSGTGFPAIPLAVMLPKTSFVLIEKVARKCAFLKMVTRRLELLNVKVEETLLQDWHSGEPGIPTAITRAVRVDSAFKEQLSEKGIRCLLYFSSQPTKETILEYQLPDETKNRYLDRISLRGRPDKLG
ncbi:MAG: hypothetical protein DRJ08_04910 [Acidobacteria bacterium]|nr:MAG: hypothetical protein DRJ14_07810 [Acidobacteriota bacterium]RLE21893.1 MAG: hypothetical protein DRJ08_04910 [Acidobacteriota bacterium]